MNESVETDVIARFRERLQRGDLGDDCEVTWRVAGGMPRQQLDEEFKLAAGGRVHVRRLDQLRGIPAEETDAILDPAETAELLSGLEAALGEMMLPSEAQFGPDSLIGWITVEIAGEQATLCFDPAEPEAGRLEELAWLAAESAQTPSAAPALRPSPVRGRQAGELPPAAGWKMAERLRTASVRLFERGKEHGHG